MRGDVVVPKRRSNTIGNSTKGLIGGSGFGLSENVIEALGEESSVENITDLEATRRARDIRDEINRNISGEVQDDNHFHVDNESEFREELNNINDDSIEYEYKNVLNENLSTFGVELEFVRGNADAIARELYELGIVSRLLSRGEAGKWKLERDGTVSNGSVRGKFI